MNSVIEQLEARQYMSTTLSGATFLDIQPTEAVVMDQVSNGDKEDTYIIRVMKAGTVNFRLEGLTGDAALEFITDRNKNNRLDAGEISQFSNKLQAQNEKISRFVSAGTYFVRVRQSEGNAVINYTLRYSTQAFTTPDQVDQSGNSTAAARDLSVPKGGNRTVNEVVGNGDVDVFRLNVTETAKYDIRLSGITRDADITLSDANGTVLASTAGKPRTAKLITGKLTAGTYFVTVSTPAQTTPYALRVVSTAARTTDVDLTTKRAAAPKSLPQTVFSSKLIESL